MQGGGVSGTDLIVARLDTARIALAEAATPQQAKAIADIAVAAKIYAKRQNLGAECIQYATELTTDAERKLGELLRDMDKNEGGRPPSETPTTSEGVSVARLADLGIDYKTSSRAQRLAELSEEKFAAVRSGEVGLTAALRELRHDAKQTQPFPTDTYRVIYADPPWSYGNSGVINDSDGYGHAARHYPSMSIAELCALPVREMAGGDAVLFMWVTSPLLAECFEVIAAWGFKYKTSFVWDKVAHNFGHYNSVRHEFLLICTRGSCTPDNPVLVDSVQVIEKTRKHSEKPDEFRRIIDNLYPRGRRIELFARATVDGWDAWGNEASASAA